VKPANCTERGQLNTLQRSVITNAIEFTRHTMNSRHTKSRGELPCVPGSFANCHLFLPPSTSYFRRRGPYHRAATLAAIWSAILTAESAGLALHVLTSIMTLFLSASARPQPQPGAPAFSSVAVVLSVPFALAICPTDHRDPLCVWEYWRHAGHCRAEASKKAPAFSTIGNNTTACLR
jgi:hypothetical protein